MKPAPLMVLVAACAAVLDTAPAAAQNAVVQAQLDEMVVQMAGRGLARWGDFRYGALRTGAREVHQVQLRGGFVYALVAFCDEDCTDIDLQLHDAAGNLVDSDFELDDRPVVTAEVPRDATFRLTVSMPSCSIEPCYYGVAVFGQRP
jgi:hypothetical protein